MIIKLFKRNKLLKQLSSPYYIHLKDHNERINPQETRLKLSYMNPKWLAQGAPKQPYNDLKLSRRNQKNLKNKLFEQYKINLLKGQIYKQEQITEDPLWNHQKPNHYYSHFSFSKVSKVSAPQNQDGIRCIEKFIKQILQPQQQSKEQPHTIVRQALQLYQQQTQNRTIDRERWYKLQLSLKKKLYLLSTKEIIQLKFVFNDYQSYATPQFNIMLNDLMLEDATKMTYYQSLMSLYSFRKEHHSQSKTVQAFLNVVIGLARKMTVEEKILGLIVYSISFKPLTTKPSHKKILGEDYYKGVRFLHEIQLDPQPAQLTPETACMLVFGLAKLKIFKCNFLVEALTEYLATPRQYTPHQLYTLLFYSSYVQDLRGLNSHQPYLLLFEEAQKHWEEFRTVQKIRMLYSLFLQGQFSEVAHQLYKQISISSEGVSDRSSQIYYFCQIQMRHPSGRSKEIIWEMTRLQCIPLAYYQTYHRFYNLVKEENPSWDLSPIKDKLSNTEIYYDVLRVQHNFLVRYGVFGGLYKYTEKWVKGELKRKFASNFPFMTGVPIENQEYVMFAFPQHQISLDLVSDRDTIRGSTRLKPTVVSKIQNLRRLGWKHLTIHQKDIQPLHVLAQLREIYRAGLPFREEQSSIMQVQDQKRTQQLIQLGVDSEIALTIGQQLEQQMHKAEYQQEFENVKQDKTQSQQQQPQQKQQTHKKRQKQDKNKNND